MRAKASLSAFGLFAFVVFTSCTPALAPSTSPHVTDAGLADAAPNRPVAVTVPSPEPKEWDLGPEEVPEAGVTKALDEVAREAKGAPRSPVPSAPWDGKAKPKYLDLVVERYGMTNTERTLLQKNGMVVLSRVNFPSYGYAMHEIHRQELPLYVTVDSVLEAIFRSHEDLIVRAEGRLATRLGEVLERLHKELVADTKSKVPRYAPEVAKDADVYLGVARSLLEGGDPKSELGQEKAVEQLVSAATAATAVDTVDLFGRSRKIDFTFYEPRGVYLDHQELHTYFRAMVWLTRLEMNLVSRGSRSSAPTLTTEETPREATLALVLADLVERAGATTDVARVDRYQRVLAGKREDVPLSELAKITKLRSISLRDPALASATLRAEIGSSYKRTVNHHVMPYGTNEGSLPAIATFFGVAITADARSLVTLAPSSLPPHVPRGPELGYLFGADAGARYVDPTGSFALLKSARTDLEGHLSPNDPDLHSAWTQLVRGAAEIPKGTIPSFVGKPAAADRRIATAMAGYAQIHHAHVLHTAQVYDFAGCTIPDAYVEPNLATYDGTLAYTKRLEELTALFPVADDDDTSATKDAVARLAEVTRALQTIVRDELAGRAVSDKQLAFLRMVAEYIPSTGGYEMYRPGRFNGWYPRMHAARDDAFKKVPFSIDHFTSTRLGQVAFVGEGRPALGVFVVDVGGEPRVMVGPVTRAYDRVKPLEKRRVEADVEIGVDTSNVLDMPPIAAYEKSYVAPLAHPPTLTISTSEEEATISSKVDLRGLTIELFDEHGKTLASGFVKDVRASKGDSDAQVTVKLVPVTKDGVPASSSSEGQTRARVRFANGEVHSIEGLSEYGQGFLP